MKRLPVDDPGEPDSRSAARYLLWMIRTQKLTIACGIGLGIVWMVSQALVPAALGAGVDALATRDRAGLLTAGAALLGLGTITAVSGIMRHRFAVTNFLAAGFRTMQVTVRHATRLGVTLQRKVSTGEVVSIGTTDFDHIGYSLDVTARAGGAVVAIVVVSALLLQVSVPLGLVVIVGVPLLVATVGLLIKPLHRRRRAQRDLAGDLTNRASDIVSGLRVLRGVGGEAVFAGRYRAESQQVRAAGIRVAKIETLLEGAQILLPGLFVALVTWLGARFAVAGRISPGELVAFYAYAAFLVSPLRTLTEFAEKLTRGLVAAGRVVTLLRIQPEFGVEGDELETGGDLRDPASGFVARRGLLTAVAAARPEDASAIADRIGLLAPDSGALLGDVQLKTLRTGDVRAEIVVADNDDRLFRGRLGDEIGEHAAARDAAAAQDIIDALPAGLDTEIAERGRDFSGGQQQRLRLARVLAADPTVLVLVEPTSAVDAHTEARIARRLPPARAGRTTVVCTTSPLLLDRADAVAFVGADGRVAAVGTHRELLAGCPAYAATVTREEDT